MQFFVSFDFQADFVPACSGFAPASCMIVFLKRLTLFISFDNEISVKNVGSL